MKKLFTLLTMLLIGIGSMWATDGSVTITSNSTAWSANGTFSNTSGSNAGSWRSTNGIISVLCLNGQAAILNYETKSRLSNNQSFLIVANGDNHITGFSIKFKTYNEDGTNRNGYITFHDGVNVSSNNSAEVTKSFSGLNAQVIKFTTGNNWVDIIDFSVSYAEGSDNTLCSTTPINTFNDEAYAGWLKVQTPSDYIFYTMSSLRMNLRTNSYNHDVYLVVSDHQVGSGATSGLSESDFTAISSNSSGTSSTDVTFNFTNPVTLRGGSIYYLYFATKSDDTYTLSVRGIKVQTGSNSLGIGSTIEATSIHSSSNTWSIPFTATLTPVTSNLKCRLKAKWPNTSTSTQHYTNYVFAKTNNLDKLYKNNKTELSAADMINAKMVWNVTYSGSGLKLQNVGTERYISKFSDDKKNGDAINLLTANNSTDAETLKIQEYNTQGQGYIALVSGNQLSENNKISFLESFSSTNEYVGCHNNYDAGDAFIFERVKTVTFVDGEGEAFNVAVNGGDAVSAIYVACDGSSASTLSLPSDNLYSLDSGETWLSNTDAASIISAAGTSNISVIVAPAVSVTYNLIWDDPSTPIKTENSVNAPQGFSPSVTVPWNVPAFCSFSYDVETIESTTAEVNVTLNWNGPFDFSKDFASAKWYYMAFNGGYLIYDETAPYGFSTREDAIAAGEDAIWAFIGDPYNGVRVINKTAGNGKYLNLDTPVQMAEATYPRYSLCGITENSTSETIGFSLDNDDYYLCYYVPNEGDPYLWYGQGEGWAATSKGRITVEPYIVTYNLKFGGSTIATKTVDKVTGDSEDLLPSEWERDFCTYSYEPAEIGNSTTSVDVTMTWDGPFDISADYENAVWYYMAVNGKWSKQVAFEAPNIYDDISEVKGLDVGEWAFYGNPYDGFLLSPKAKYSTYQIYLSSAAETPAFTLATESTEKWVAKKISGSTFTLNCGDKYLVDNSTTMGFKTTALEGSEGTFSVRSYYCQKFIDDIYVWADANHRDEYFGPSETSLTTLTGNVATLMSNMSKTTYDGFTIPDDILSDIVLKYPTTGFYRIKNKLTTGEYGYIGVSGTSADANVYLKGNISNANDASTIIYITKDGSGKYNLQTQGKYIRNVRKDEKSYLIDNAPSENFAMDQQGPGYGVIKTWADGPYSYLHAAAGNSYYLVGWENNADASQWVFEDATSLDVTLNSDGATTPTYYATFCAPFSYTVSEGTKAYTLEQSGEWLVPTEIEGEVAAGTPVLLKGSSATATLTIGSGYAESPLTTTALTGTYVATTVDTRSASKNYVFGKNSSGAIGFYHVNNQYFPLKANRAYMNTSASNARGFSLMFDDDVTGIVSTSGETEEGAVIYNISGQRMNKMQKGINIVNGKKVLF